MRFTLGHATFWYHSKVAHMADELNFAEPLSCIEINNKGREVRASITCAPCWTGPKVVPPDR